MKKSIINIFTIGMLSLSTIGCSDYLDITDDTSVSPDNFPTNMEQVELLLNSAYAGSHTQGLYAFYWFPMGMYLYDKTSNTYDNYDDRANQLTNNTDPSCQYTTWTYAGIMQWIEYSNAAIEGIEGYYDKAAEKDKETLDYQKGQALFNRALAYWHAQIFYELESKSDGLGFPIIDHVPTGITEMMPERATVAESWDFMISTLNEAITLLKGYNTDKTRATEWAAKGLLAKALMQARRTSEAIPVLEDIINNSGAQLLPWETYKESFYADEKYEFNVETLYEIDMTTNMKQNGPWAGFTTGSAMPMVFGPWPLNLAFTFRKAPEAGTEITTQSTGAWGNNYVHDRNLPRFGFNLGNWGSRVENPNYNKKLDRSIDNLPWILDPDYAAESQRVRDEKIADPRLFVCAAQPYFDTMLDAHGDETYYDRSPEAQPYFDKWICFNHKKFTNREGTEQSQNYSSAANYPIVRLADIYLLYAEAIQSTNPTKALEYINKVHRRAYGCDPDTPSEYDYASLTDRTKALAEDVNLANSPLRYERWAELFAEGQWWYDIRRWEILENEMNYYQDTRNGNLIYYGDRCYAQPIPLTEIERYNGNLEQNYNY